MNAKADHTCSKFCLLKKKKTIIFRPCCKNTVHCLDLSFEILKKYVSLCGFTVTKLRRRMDTVLWHCVYLQEDRDIIKWRSYQALKLYSVLTIMTLLMQYLLCRTAHKSRTHLLTGSQRRQRRTRGGRRGERDWQGRPLASRLSTEGLFV